MVSIAFSFGIVSFVIVRIVFSFGIVGDFDSLIEFFGMIGIITIKALDYMGVDSLTFIKIFVVIINLKHIINVYLVIVVKD